MVSHYSPVVSGSASFKALSHAAHLSHRKVAGLGIDPWAKHAESKANIADTSSHMRTSRSHHQQHGFPEIDLVESTACFPLITHLPEEWAHRIQLFHSSQCRYSRANPERY